MKREYDGMSDVMYQCINLSMGTTNYTTTIEDFDVSINCISDGYSGA